MSVDNEPDLFVRIESFTESFSIDSMEICSHIYWGLWNFFCYIRFFNVQGIDSPHAITDIKI